MLRRWQILGRESIEGLHTGRKGWREGICGIVERECRLIWGCTIWHGLTSGYRACSLNGQCSVMSGGVIVVVADGIVAVGGCTSVDRDLLEK